MGQGRKQPPIHRNKKFADMTPSAMAACPKRNTTPRT
jgi:hypothetical protein